MSQGDEQNPIKKKRGRPRKKVDPKTPAKASIQVRKIEETELPKGKPAPKVEAMKIEKPKKSAKKTAKKKAVKKPVVKKEKPIKTETPKRKPAKKPVKKLVMVPDVKEKKQVVHSKRTQKDRVFLMWTGVSFFMLLIMIFWIYNTKQSLTKTKLEWAKSSGETEWSDLAEELSSQISKMKTDLQAVGDFASTSVTMELQEGTDIQLFQTNKPNEELSLDSDDLARIQKELEIKTGDTKPDINDYFYNMKEQEKEEFLNELKKIKIGDTAETIEKTIGKADYDEVLTDKREAFIVRVMNYYLSIYKEDEVNETFDQYVSLEFNEDGVLTRIDKQIQ